MYIISGEQLQALSEISFCSDIDSIKTDQIKAIPQNLHIIPAFKQEDIKRYHKIFIYTDFIIAFMDRFSDHLDNDTIILTHNSDCGIDETHIPYIEHTKIKKWFCQNRYINHTKLISLPIGIANSQWPHGKQELINKIKNEGNRKEYLVYKNFDIGTNVNKRSICNNITLNNGIPMSLHVNNEEYWRNISKSIFTIAPHGNGVDSHRIWESLYLGTIPIIQRHECFKQFEHLPILITDDWSDITPDFLLLQYNNRFKHVNFDMQELQIEYWANKINF